MVKLRSRILLILSWLVFVFTNYSILLPSKSTKANKFVEVGVQLAFSVKRSKHKAILRLEKLFTRNLAEKLAILNVGGKYSLDGELGIYDLIFLEFLCVFLVVYVLRIY